MSEQIQVTGPDGPVPVHLEVPAGAGPWPGVVVVHDALGMSADLRRQASWLAGEGFVTAAPDLVAGRGSVRCLRESMRELRSGRGRMTTSIVAVRDALAARADCTGRIGVVGFCMGGGFALLLAPSGRFDAASVNYGATRDDMLTADFLRGTCPVVGSYGRRDPSLRGAAAKLETALTTLGVDHDVVEYPDASHSFLNDHDPGDLTPLFRVSAMLGLRYHAASAADARRRITTFLTQHLQTPPPPPPPSHPPRDHANPP